jgi:signal transduction histidine kinase/ActR/RegA family two-component response regulator
VGRHSVNTIIILSITLIIFSSLIGLFVTLRALKDMDELQRYEEELSKSRKLESVGRLAGGIAHDFNNMLMPIISYSNLMLLEQGRSEEDRERLEQVKLAGTRAAELIKQLLAFSRKQILEIKNINLNDVVQEMQKMMRRLIGENIELHISLEGDLGNVNADHAQIDQILLNLVVNARDAMPGGGKLTIETQNVYLDQNYARTHREVIPGNYVMLAVSDTGVGMEAETRERVFEPFFTTKEVGKGTGLGMATIYGIVKQHEGNINVYSEPGQGTTFKVYMPRVDGKAQEIKPPVDDIPQGAGEVVMVVEDERQVFELVCEIIGDSGYKLLRPTSPQRALEMAMNKERKIDLLLTDVIMPGMSGKQLYEKISEIRPDIKVVYMSGYTDNVIAHHGILDPGIHFLQKPFTESTLLNKLREALDENS